MRERVLSETFEKAVWETYLIHTRTIKKTTSNLHQYLEKLSLFTKKEITQIEKEDVEQYMEYLYQCIERGEYCPSYVKVMFLSLRKFFGFLQQHRYELRDRGVNVQEQNPFEGILLRIPDKKLLSSEDIPTIQEIDRLLQSAKSQNPSLYLAICLASKLGLSISELSELKLSALGYMKEEYLFESVEGIREKNLYICLPGTNKRTNRYLKVPREVEEVIAEKLDMKETAENAELSENEQLETLERNHGNNIYVITYKGKHYSERTMQYHLKKLCEQLQLKNITFADLRNLSIFMMRYGGAKDSEIARFTGQKGRWICRFSGVDPKVILGTADYNHLDLGINSKQVVPLDTI